MRHARTKRRLLVIAMAATIALAAAPATAGAQEIPDYDFASATFGLSTAPDGSLLVADLGAGIVELRKGQGSLVAPLPGISDMDAIGRSSLFAIGLIGDWGFYLVRGGQATRIADLLEFEAAVNPDGGTGEEGIDSNPFDVEALDGSTALIADAGANALLVADRAGTIDWVATLPVEVVSTANIKSLAGCPTPVPGTEFVCGLPAAMPTQAVATSVAIGPDGAYYVGELKGFPAPTGVSKIWRIEPGTRHAACGTSPACTVVADSFTSIVDLSFGPDGTLYVTEIDENSWAPVEPEFPPGLPAAGGTVNACTFADWSCSEVATGLTIPMATAIGKDGTVYVLTEGLLPSAKVIALP